MGDRSSGGATRWSKNKPGIHKDFTKNINDSFKSDPDDSSGRAAKKFNDFCENIPPRAKDGTIEWILPLNEEIPKHTIVLLAHSVRPIRCIAEITKNEQCSKSIPLNYRYVIEKLMKKDVPREELETADTDDEEDDYRQKKKKGATRLKKRRIETIMTECGKKQQQLISKKKGFWLIWKTSLEAKITTKQLSQHMDTILGWYESYVEGMEKDPSTEYPRKAEDRGMEQFLLCQYPTPEWRKHTHEYQKTNKNHKEEGGMTIPPPPPPPPPAPPADDESSDEEESEGGATKATKKKKKGMYDLPPPTGDTKGFQPFDHDDFSKFMQSFEPQPPPPQKNDSLPFDELGDLPDIDEVASI